MSGLALLQAGCLTALAVLLLAAAWQDLRSLSIANELSLALAAVFVAWAIAGMASDAMSPATLAIHAVVALGVFAIGAVAFAAGALGGGDVKLLAATSLFAGPALLLDLLLVMALAGGAIGVAMLAGVPVGPAIADATSRRHVPYGPAIAAGGLWVAVSLALS